MSNFKPMTSQEAHDLLYSKYEMEDDSDPMIRPYSKEEGWVVQMGEDSYTNDMPNAPYEDAKLLAHAERALRTIMEMGKKLTTANDARKAHELLDELDARAGLSQEQEKLLRSFLPELPKQKTLEEIGFRVYDAWIEASGNKWGGNSYDPDVSIEDWLGELHAQIKGLMDAPANTPALPAGMRIAEHEEYGRVVTSPKPDQDGVYVLLAPRPKVETGADWEYAHECELTFIDDEPAKPARPEFLETEADYQNAPEGTVVVKVDALPWVKEDDNNWTCPGGSKGDYSMSLVGSRRILRWGWGE